MSEVTVAEMIQIANSFLLASPPGEFMEVVTDLRGLLPDDSIINDSAPATFREWNTDQMLQVKSPSGGHEVLITKYGEVNDSEYLDPRGKSVIQFDHIKRDIVGQRPISGELHQETEPYRAAFDNAINTYVSEHYVNGASTIYVGKKGSEFNITICISSSKFNPNNFWNGRWRSVWTCTFTSGGKVNITGTIKLNVHYYEDGNVQLASTTKKAGSVNGGDAATTAANAVKQIQKIESEFQQALDQSYVTMGDTTFKALRRLLPIIRKKMDWDWRKLQSLKVGAQAAHNRA